MSQTTQNSFFERYADFIVRWRYSAAIFFILAACVVIAGVPNLTLDTDGRVFMDDKNPDKIVLDRFEAEYAKDDTLNILIIPKDGEIFTPRTLQAIDELTEEAWTLPYVRLVNSITRFQNSYADGDFMIVEDLVVDPYSVTEAQAQRAKEIALSRVEIVNQLIDSNTSVSPVTVIFRLPGLDLANEIPEVMAEVEPMLDAFGEKYPDIDFSSTGSIAIGAQFSNSSQQDGMTLTPAMLIAMLLVVGLLLRSASGVASILFIAILAALVSLGALGWTKIPLNSATAIAPLMIITLTIASTVHILAAARQLRTTTSDRQIWARTAISEHGLAITVACLTTALGFLSLNFSISPPFRQLGNMVAAGMIAVWIFTLAVLPALICLLPAGKAKGQALTDKIMVALGEFVIRRQRQLLIGIPLLVIAFGAGVTQIKLEDDFIRYFDERYEFRQASDYYENNLGGLNVLEYSLETGIESGINDVDFLAKANELTAYLRAQPEVSNVRSITDVLKRLNQNMNNDDTSYYRLPASEDEASQFLFLYELSLGYGMDLTDQINVDRSAIRITAYVPNVTTADMLSLDGRVQSWFDDNAPELKTPVTGQSIVYTMISARDVPAMLQGTLLALVGISAIILLVLRNVQLGLISLVPNLIPALMAFGLWGYMMGTITLAVSVVVAMTLGIVVDDTVHFMLKYANGRKKGLSGEDAVRYAFKSVGMALTVTSVGLVVGFAILGQSGFAVNRDLARLTAITLAFALVVDFLLLPPLLIWMDKMKDKISSIKTATTAMIIGVVVITAGGIYGPKALADEAKGLAIAQEQSARDAGFGDVEVSGQMVLKNKAGKESVRVFTSRTLEQPAGEMGDKSIIIFTKPRDIRGTSMLTHSNLEPNDDDQWLFLPAVKRVKRISSSNRTGKFVSSEFSYEDLGSEEVEDNTHIWLRDEPCPNADGLTCFVVESQPKNKKSGYSKRVSYIDTAEYRVHKIEYYNRRGDLEKTLSFSGYQQYLDKFWRAGVMEMMNLQTGKSTKLQWDNYQFQVGLSEKDFSPQSLPKAARK